LLVTAATTGDEAERVAKRLQVEGFVALFLDFDPAYGIPAGRDSAAYQSAGQVERALPLFEQALAERRRCSGPAEAKQVGRW
jgi:hypothetical protein